MVHSTNCSRPSVTDYIASDCNASRIRSLSPHARWVSLPQLENQKIMDQTIPESSSFTYSACRTARCSAAFLDCLLQERDMTDSPFGSWIPKRRSSNCCSNMYRTYSRLHRPPDCSIVVSSTSSSQSFSGIHFSLIICSS